MCAVGVLDGKLNSDGTASHCDFASSACTLGDFES